MDRMNLMVFLYITVALAIPHLPTVAQEPSVAGLYFFFQLTHPIIISSDAVVVSEIKESV